MSELKLLPLEFIENICWSKYYDNTMFKDYHQIKDLQDNQLTNRECEIIAEGFTGNLVLMRWILKDEVYLFLKEKNIKLTLMQIKDVDFDNIDLEVSSFDMNTLKDFFSLSFYEQNKIKKSIVEHNERNCKLLLRKKYDNFPLYCRISNDDLLMLKLMI